MVKIPGLDDLKKMGSDLLDSAKTVNISGVMDKIKSVGGPGQPPTNEALGVIYQNIHATLSEWVTIQNKQTELVKKMQSQLTELGTVVERLQKAASATVVATSEEKKGNE